MGFSHRPLREEEGQGGNREISPNTSGQSTRKLARQTDGRSGELVGGLDVENAVKSADGPPTPAPEKRLGW